MINHIYKVKTKLSKAVIIELFERLHRRADQNPAWHSKATYPDYSMLIFTGDVIVMRNFNTSQFGKGAVYNIFISFEDSGSENVIKLHFKPIKDIKPIYWCILMECIGIVAALILNLTFKVSIVGAATFFICVSVLSILVYWSNSPLEPESLEDCVKLVLSDVHINDEITVIED